MKCQKCLSEVPEVLATKVEWGESIHCPYCTDKLEVENPLLDVDPYGIWQVETEKTNVAFEVVGRKLVGNFKGYLVDVIAKCAPYKEHSLYIRELEPAEIREGQPQRPEEPVSVHLEGRRGATNEHLLRSYLADERVSVDGTNVEWVD